LFNLFDNVFSSGGLGAVMNGNRCALRGQREANRPPDATRTTRYQRNPPC
jgi:hypothetical protein